MSAVASDPIQIAVLRLIETRNALRSILGDRYAETVDPYRVVLRGLVAEAGKPIAAVTLQAANDMEAKGHDPSMFFCAFVEECGA